MANGAKRKRPQETEPAAVAEEANWLDEEEMDRMRAKKTKLEEKEPYNDAVARRRARRIAKKAASRSVLRSAARSTSVAVAYFLSDCTSSEDGDPLADQDEERQHAGPGGSAESTKEPKRTADDTLPTPHATDRELKSTALSPRKVKRTKKKKRSKQASAWELGQQGSDPTETPRELPAGESRPGSGAVPLASSNKHSRPPETESDPLQTSNKDSNPHSKRRQQTPKLRVDADGNPLPKSKRALRRSRASQRKRANALVPPT